MSFWEEVLANAIAYGAVVLVTVAAMGLVLWLRPGILQRLLPLQRIREGKWGGIEVLFSFVIIAELGSIVREMLVQMGFFGSIFGQGVTPQREILWTYPLYFFLALGLLIFWLFGMSRTRPSHLGLSRARWPQGILQGGLIFIVTTPLVLGVFIISLQVFPEQTHPFEKLTQEELWTLEWGLLFFQACIGAPVIEEVFFRGILQSWLRRASVAGHIMLCVWTLIIASAPLMASLEGHEGSMGLEDAWQPIAFAGLAVAWYGLNFFQVWKGILREGPFYLMVPTPREELEKRQIEADSESDEEEAESGPLLQIDPERWQIFQAGSTRLAIYGSAMFFAAGHSLAWPAPIALYLLGLVLGWIAHRTQNLTGSIVAHGCFNAVAFGTLLYVSAFGPRNGKDETTAARPCDGGKTVTVIPASQYPRLR